MKPTVFVGKRDFLINLPLPEYRLWEFHVYPLASAFRIINVRSVVKPNNLKIGEGVAGGTPLSSRRANFTVSNFPRALSHDCPVHDRVLRALQRCCAGSDDAPRFGLYALRSRISRYTYATRDLLPMIMRGWKYAPQEDEEEEEMGPRPRLSNGRYRLT